MHPGLGEAAGPQPVDEPVSYTHLDVYKRQVLYAPADSTLYQVKEAGKAQYLLTVIG